MSRGVHFVTLDVRIAFNFVRWTHILSTLRKTIPSAEISVADIGNYFKISIFFTTPFDEDLPIKLNCERGRLTSDKLMLVYFVVQLSEETLINSKRIPTEHGSPTILTMKFL